MFVVAADFATPPYVIPELGVGASFAPNTSFADYVDAEEIVLLDKLLGKTLRKEFYAALTPGPPAQKWVDLRDGAQYTLNDVVYTYGGLKEFLKPYICAMWTRDNFDSNSVVGVAVSNTENAETISPSTRIVRDYNAMSRIVGSECNVKDTLYGFLKSRPDDFLNWLFEAPGTMNLWNI